VLQPDSEAVCLLFEYDAVGDPCLALNVQGAAATWVDSNIKPSECVGDEFRATEETRVH